jgi:ferredoxin
MKATVNEEKCQGHLRCVLYAEQIFEIDDQGHATATPGVVAPELEEGVRLAQMNCPEQAISVED